MKVSKTAKRIMYALVPAYNLLWGGALWLCGQRGNIMLGIICICFYRLSLWLAPLAVTVICWLPSKLKLGFRKKLLMNAVLLLLCGLLYILCYLLFGNWF